ncbi:hypothetical protein OEA_22385 [Priestia megaterium NCT-2]|nr:hypothetical protein OEA_22385 [Priestia megaterium NCT-2]
MIGGQGKDSCGKSGRGETPAVSSDLCELMYPICSYLGWGHFVMFQPFLCIIKRMIDIFINI